MGEGAYLADFERDQPVEETPTWVCADGRKIRVVDMTDSHLANTIALLERSFKRSIADMIAHPPNFQGEMAQMAAEEEWLNETLQEIDEVYPIYGDLTAEVARRKNGG